MYNNTITIFLGDNGGPHFESHSNIPLRGGKKTWWEVRDDASYCGGR
jgi:hypothetical protein